MPFEKFEIKRPEIPTGKGKEVSEALRDYLLLFEKVKNKVVFVNQEVNIPLKLEEGKESPLGLFVRAVLPYEEYELKDGEKRLEAWPEHGRSALLGRIIFRDKEGHLYRDIDLKGIGYIREREIKRPGPFPWGYAGILERKDAFYANEMQEKFLKAGIRVPRTLAIIELEEIIYEGKKISLKEARKREIIKKRFPLIRKRSQPVIEVRAFMTKARIENIILEGKWPEEIKKLVLEDAKKLVSQEIGKPLSDKEYLQWFAETLGQNSGLMHKNGWCRRRAGLWLHDITLGCQIVDLDAIRKLKTKEDLENDKARAKQSLRDLTRAVIKESEFENIFSECERQFLESYDAIFPPEERTHLFKKPKV